VAAEERQLAVHDAGRAQPRLDLGGAFIQALPAGVDLKLMTRDAHASPHGGRVGGRRSMRTRNNKSAYALRPPFALHSRRRARLRGAADAGTLRAATRYNVPAC